MGARLVGMATAGGVSWKTGRGCLVAWVAALTLAGCGGGGSGALSEPDRTVPDVFLAGLPAPEQASRADLAQWWRSFGDPVLTLLIENDASGNFDLRAAESRLREARALARAERSGLFPTLGMGASAEGRAELEAPGSTRPDATSLFSAGFDAAWEVDLFGGAQRSADAADAGAAVAAERMTDVLISLSAEIATIYIDLRGAQRRLDLAEQSLRLQQRTRDLVREQAAVGVASRLDVSRADAAVARLEAGLPGLAADIDRAINRLSVLSGREPGYLRLQLIDPRPIPSPALHPSPGLPADLLRRRPDIRAAEHSVLQAAARLDVAVADLYPRLVIPGSITLSASGLGAGALVQTMVATLGATLSLPLFDAGRRQANVDVAEEQAQQSLFAYRQTLLLALEEVEDGLIAYRQSVAQRDALVATEAASRRATALAAARFEGGLSSFLEVLDAQRELAEISQELTVVEEDLARSAVRIYKAVGGGWSAPAGGAAML